MIAVVQFKADTKDLNNYYITHTSPRLTNIPRMADNESEGATHVMAPPPKMYYKQYTNLAVANNTTPPPPPPPIGEYSAFGITHNVSTSNQHIFPFFKCYTNLYACKMKHVDII